ncbi:MAG: DUF882 domain-containing protein [Ahrensia sp.]
MHKSALTLIKPHGIRFGALLRLLVCAIIAVSALPVMSTSASAETRTLKLYYTHTKERATITFKRNGKYDQGGLQKLNRFLRDWRSKESIRMDPQLFDIVWEAYQEVGARDYIHVVSSYRSPATNAMLRRTRGGQANKSQHMLGKALDFYIPGVSVKKLREVGFKLQGGGVGYYPKSGVPFVHFDTGNVRAWPRMSRNELSRIFPRGGTLHLPTDGKPLPGYQQALADYNARKARGQATVNSGSGGGERRSGNLLAALFGGGDDEEEDSIESTTTQRPSAPVQRAAPAAAPETPGTLLAALSPNQLPRPTTAPRGNVGGVPVAITPQAPVAAPAAPQVAPAAAPQAPVEPVVEPEVQVAALPDYTPPIPTQRPAVLLARVEPDDNERRNAAEIEATLAAADAVVQTVTEGQAATPSDTVIASLPIPGTIAARPEELPATVVAYAPPTPAAAPAAAFEPTIDNDAIAKAARLPVPAQRAQRETIQTASLSNDAPLVTTPKAPRPLPGDATPQPMVRALPAQTIELGDHLTTTASLADSVTAKERPDFMKNAQRAAPQVVYTQGFSRQAPPPDTGRFSGNAVTFLAVAKFQGSASAGDGQPLQLQVPVVN